MTQATLTALALGLAGLAALAQPADPPPHDGPPGGPGGRPKPPLLVALDTDGDGILSAQEIANASASLKKLDQNNDGQLTFDELRPPRPAGDTNAPDGSHPDHPPRGGHPPGGPGQEGPGRGGFHPPAPPLMAALDTDHDGVLSAQEIADAPAALKKLDKNNDGQLTPEELRPEHGGPHGHGPGHDGPPPAPNDQ